MNELVFQVVFQSDIVLPATSNTEGNIGQLDFIPGSNFLGMAAREYDKYDDSFNVFHSGKVRFGDATLLIDEKETYKMPLSFFHDKLIEDVLVNHHHVKNFSKYKQLKQKRNGYITKDLDEVEVKYNYAQKSAYDKQSRKSKESAMFGYSSIPEGTIWQFTVNYDNTLSSSDVEKIQNTLIGQKRLGKSRSAQYGKVNISLQGSVENVEETSIQQEVILYAKSRLSLVDSEGNATYDLKYLTEGLTDKNIVWDKSQLRTSSYARYDGTRRATDYERVIINSGSVMVLRDVTEKQLKKIQSGVGLYLVEGFGKILVNPSFLSKKEEFSFKEKTTPKEAAKLPLEDNLALFLDKKDKDNKEQLALADKVAKFMTVNKSIYKNINNAQWGKIRSICNSRNPDFKAEIKEYISSGKVSWDSGQIMLLLDENGNKNHSLEFIKLLSMNMPKENADD
ncbi:FIG00470522: hypothetical protein [hydrothermal vent metagenome]|uniref:Uncharacterized protein n=1 Tax=hydrothermal vent metagenome TaxID=652676 RepID=A0A1W1EEH9_9ZZZZ